VLTPFDWVFPLQSAPNNNERAMSADPQKPVLTESPAADAPSGWDPFTVWRERVHQPRAQARAPRSAPIAEQTLAVLRPIKQSG